MSGRSAHVRKKNNNDRKSSAPRNSSVSGVQIVPANTRRDDSVEAISRYHGNQGMHQGYYEHASKPYYAYQGYQPDGYGPPRQSRSPIVIASAIEKSDIRTQVDGLSDKFRGGLGRMFGGKGSSKDKASSERSGPWDGGSTHSAPPADAVPSLVHSGSTDEASRPGAHSLPYNVPNPKATSPGHGGAYGHFNSSASLPSQDRSEVTLFSGHRENRGRRTWRNLSRSPECLAPVVDTIVRLFAPSSTSQPLAVFHVSSQVLKETGHKKWIDMLEDYTPPATDAPDNATMSSEHSHPDYMTEGRASQSDQPRPQRLKNVKFELILDCPDDGLDIDPMNWVMTTRNYFAILHDHDTLCGRTLYEALLNLMARLNDDSDYFPPTKNKKQFVLDYIERHRFLDVRNNAGYAISLLAFSQQSTIQWREAAIEAFVHCVGMRIYSALNYPEAQHLSPYTNILITNMSKELKQRLIRAQKHFASFDFSEMWPAKVPVRSGGRAAYERFRTWLSRYVARLDLQLPEAMAKDEVWMTQERIQRYAKMFHSLFDYLVNRDVEYDGSEYQTNERWAIVSKSGIYFKPDPNPDLPMTEILNDFDRAKGFPHLLAPYPLVPPSQPPRPVTSKSKSSGKKVASPSDEELDAKSASYTEASNFFLLGHDSNMDPVVSEFVQFEQSDDIQNVDPRDARLGRWVLIYGALQILATIETITPGVRYKDGVRYCMSCKVSGVLPWIKEREGESQEALSPMHQMSYPFTAPLNWPSAIPKPRTTSYKPIQWGDYGDGRKRPDLMESPPKRPGELQDRPASVQSGNVQRTPSLVVKSNSSSKEVSEAEKARGRRQKAFGFTDYRPEPGW